MAKTKKAVHLGIPYSKKNPVKIPLCVMHSEGMRVRCGIGLWAKWETVGIDDLDLITCKKCRDNLAKRWRQGGGL